jgi:hypothetical protein
LVAIPHGDFLLPVVFVLQSSSTGLPNNFASLIYCIVIKRICKQVFLPVPNAVMLQR